MNRRVRSTLACLVPALLAGCADSVSPTAPVAERGGGPQLVTAAVASPLADGLTGSTYYNSFTIASGVYNATADGAAPVFDVFGNPYDATLLAGASVAVGNPFTGVPAGVVKQLWASFAPAPWQPVAQPTTFDVAIHLRDQAAWYAPAPFTAMHGGACAPFQMGEFQTGADASALRDMAGQMTSLGQHAVSTYDGMNYQCRNHMMTALRATAASGGYGMIYVTPNAMVDFSTGEASIKFALATLRTSGRDWVDLWITPFADNLKLPLDASLSGADMQGPPRRAIHVRMIPDLVGSAYTQSAFEAYVVNNFTETRLPVASTAGYESILRPISTRRDTFELRISQNHLSFGIKKPQSPLVVAGNAAAWNATGVDSASLLWINTPIPRLPFTRGVVQFGHHSFTPELAPNTNAAQFAGGALPAGMGGTWHWDDIRIAPAVGFTIIPSLSKGASGGRYADSSSNAATLAATTAGWGYLRFAAYGDGIQYSVDNVNWFPAARQAEKFNIANRFHSYWTPFPPGFATVYFRNVTTDALGNQVVGGTWLVRDVAFWTLDGTLNTGGAQPSGGGGD